MKYVLLLLFTSLPLFAQESYQNIKENLENTLQTYSKNGKDTKYLNTIISNFNQSEKNELEDFKKNNI